MIRSTLGAMSDELPGGLIKLELCCGTADKPRGEGEKIKTDKFFPGLSVLMSLARWGKSAHPEMAYLFLVA